MPAWITSLLRLEVSVPMPSAASSTSTSRPAWASARATAMPTTPAPTTTQSSCSISPSAGCSQAPARAQRKGPAAQGGPTGWSREVQPVHSRGPNHQATARRDIMQRRSCLAGAAAALAAPFAAPPIAAAQGSRVLKFVPDADLASLDPVWTTSYQTRDHGYMVYDTLYRQDSKFGPAPQMLERALAEDPARLSEPDCTT